MKHYLPLLAVAFLSGLFLTGCESLYQTHYTYQPPALMAGKQCLARCSEAQTVCQAACAQKNDSCQPFSHRDAKFRYHTYLNQQIVMGRAALHSPSRFYMDEHCQKSCGCVRKYNRCYRMCGGQVRAHRQ